MQAYVTCVIGVHFVGYLMLTLSLMAGITAYVSGHLQQYIGRMPLIVAGLFHCFRISYNTAG